MLLRGIDFGNIWGASGLQGFFGEGYWYHKYIGKPFDDLTFVAKTMTLEANEGNLPLKDDYTPRELFPESIRVYFGKAAALNKVGLSNPGAKALLETNKWQQRKSPFWLSWAPLTTKIDECKSFLDLLHAYKENFCSPFGLQLNCSCPNVAATIKTIAYLNILAELNIPLLVKLDATASMSETRWLAEHPACDGFVVSNAIPFKQGEQIPWYPLFGQGYPMRKVGKTKGDGGLSGSPLLPLVLYWIETVRAYGITKYINGGGGIMGPQDAEAVIKAGANSIFLGSIAFLRPWRIRKAIQHAREIYSHISS